ncbi:helix-turn-helix domain-containing protein (plasmid) [Priestia megaterium]|uniref:helix-turn-helix domain-containing protein n=1 Tax=Priestia megaterium TaxID=1404 RepID=UPI00389FF588
MSLKKYLEEQDISVRKLSEEIDERRDTINDLANNRDMNNRQIPASLLAKLMMYFDVTLDDLFTLIENNDKES